MAFRVLTLFLLVAGLVPSFIATFFFTHLHNKSEHRLFSAITTFYTTLLVVTLSGSVATELWAQVLSGGGLCFIAALIWNQFRYCGRLYMAQRRAYRVMRVAGHA